MDFTIYKPTLDNVLHDFPALLEALDPMNTYKIWMATKMNAAMMAPMDGTAVMYCKIPSVSVFGQRRSLSRSC